MDRDLEGTMKARDVMTAPVITCKSTASVKEVAKLFLQRHISAVPVVDEQDKLVGCPSSKFLRQRAVQIREAPARLFNEVTRLAVGVASGVV
jgi:predicted transcriptional regulator